MKANERSGEVVFSLPTFKGFLKIIFHVIYALFSYLFMGGLGVLVAIICVFSIFRNGAFLADLSWVEIALIVWVFYCVRLVIYSGQSGWNGFLQYVSLFSFTGWLTFFSALFYWIWFGGIPSVSFLYSNTLEFFIIFLIGMGFGLAALVASVGYNNDASHADGDNL
ncbi:hypothetical protein [Oceanospirillum sp.]|uniref:hypothetical protein n=1 Tax=Oceanospirillum sp. TaxID=2021254 RepID=UPI003A952A85